MSDIAEIFGQRVRYYRKKKNLSQEKLAELCELHPVYIGQLERGEKNASLETVMRVCRGLEITPSCLFENISHTDGCESCPQKAYNLFMKIPPDKQDAMLRLLENAVTLLFDEN